MLVVIACSITRLCRQQVYLFVRGVHAYHKPGPLQVCVTYDSSRYHNACIALFGPFSEQPRRPPGLQRRSKE